MKRYFVAGLLFLLLSSLISFVSVNLFLLFNAVAFAFLLVAFYQFSEAVRKHKIAVLLNDAVPSVICSKDGLIIAFNSAGADVFGDKGNVVGNLRNCSIKGCGENELAVEQIKKMFSLKNTVNVVLSLHFDEDRFFNVKARYVKELKAFLLTAEDETEKFSWQKVLMKQNEEAFSVLDNMGVGLYSCEKDGRLIMVNNAFCRFFGVDAAAVKERFIQDFSDEDIQNFKGEKDALFYVKDGQKSSFLLSQVTGEDGCLYGAIVPDASKVTDKDKELALTRNHISWLFGETPFGIALLDSKSLVYEVNPSLKKMLNLSEAELLNKGVADIIKQTDISVLQDKMQKVLQGKLNAAKCEVKFPVVENKIEVVKIFEIFIRPTRNINPIGENGVNGLILHFFDATEWRSLEIQTEQAQKMQAMGLMAGQIAHEFNNTLTAILGFCEFLLERHPAGDPSFADIRRIVDNANRSANLVRQLLAFARKQSLVPRITDTCESVADIMDMLRQLVGRGIEIKESYGRNLGYIRVDQGQLSHVFTNLAINSRHAMHDKGLITLNVEKFDVTEPWQMGSEVVSSGDFVKFEFSDNGDGIKKEHLDRIFEPFFSTKSDNNAGTGLGLATVYGIIKQTDGYIKVESEEGVGTTFTILLPRYEKPKDYVPLLSLAKQAEQKPSLVTITASAPVSDYIEVEQNTSKQVKILMAEDEVGVRMFAARALGKKGYNVTVCEEGMSALAKVKNGEKFDLLLTDMSMPGMTGTELAVEVKKILPDIKIIIMSGFSEDIAKGAIADEAEINFLAKPFNLQQITSMVKKIIEGNQSDKDENY